MMVTSKHVDKATSEIEANARMERSLCIALIAGFAVWIVCLQRTTLWILHCKR